MMRQFPVFRPQIYIISAEIAFPDIPCSPFDKECAGMMKFAALECCLFVIYLMMATMHKVSYGRSSRVLERSENGKIIDEGTAEICRPIANIIN